MNRAMLKQAAELLERLELCEQRQKWVEAATSLEIDSDSRFYFKGYPAANVDQFLEWGHISDGMLFDILRGVVRNNIYNEIDKIKSELRKLTVELES